MCHRVWEQKWSNDDSRIAKIRLETRYIQYNKNWKWLMFYLSFWKPQNNKNVKKRIITYYGWWGLNYIVGTHIINWSLNPIYIRLLTSRFGYIQAWSKLPFIRIEIRVINLTHEIICPLSYLHKYYRSLSL